MTRRVYVEGWRACAVAWPEHRGVPAWAVALVALLVGGLLTAVLALAAQTFYKQQLRQRFELLASERFSRIAERLDQQQQRLDGLRRFFSLAEAVTPQAFNAYARPLLQRTLAYAWAPRVEAAQRAEFERQASVYLGPGYVVRDQDEHGQWHPAQRVTITSRCSIPSRANCLGCPMGSTSPARPRSGRHWRGRSGQAAWRFPDHWPCSMGARTHAAC